MNKILVTGCAGFIGFHTAKALLEQGDTVIGIDNLDPYYDVSLKQARLQELEKYPRFLLHILDIVQQKDILDLALQYPDITHVIHLAAQAGVRHSLSHPFKYAQVNVAGHLSLLELCRHLSVKQMIYASSSSVYGANHKLPFSTTDEVNLPLSLYAATKRSAELMSIAYAQLFGIPCTGLRFFTVYGPWGRPDMAAFTFTQALLKGEDIVLFNYGQMKRNFTYIDDIVRGILACLNHVQFPPSVPHRLYNLGGTQSTCIKEFIETLENLLHIKGRIRFEPLQPGDVPETIADIRSSQEEIGFYPTVPLKEGLSLFLDWYKSYYKMSSDLVA